MMQENIDAQDMLGVLREFPQQIAEGYAMGGKLKVDGIDKILVAGMGGSALSGEIMMSYLDLKIPLFISKDYHLPKHVDSGTLVFAISYSGDTEETIEAYRDAVRKGCRIIVITSGGKLDMLARKQDIPLVLIPRGIQPRLAYGYIFFSMLRVLANSGIIPDHQAQVDDLAAMLKNEVFMKRGEELAEHLIGRIPLIYSSQDMAGVAYKWKINFNENSKLHAFCNVIPEMNHNEIIGFTDLNGEYYGIILKNDADHERIKLRMDLTKQVMKSKGVEVTEIGITGANHLSKIFSAIYIGDWVSYFVAIKNKVDPTPVDVIRELKKKLAR